MLTTKRKLHIADRPRSTVYTVFPIVSRARHIVSHELLRTPASLSEPGTAYEDETGGGGLVERFLLHECSEIFDFFYELKGSIESTGSYYYELELVSLCFPTVVRELIRLNDSLHNMGVSLNLCIARMPEGFGRPSKSFYQGLYSLLDAGVDLSFRGLDVCDALNLTNANVHSIFSCLRVDAVELGISSSEEDFDLSLYMQRATDLTGSLQDNGVPVMVMRVDSSWAESLVMALPACLFQGKATKLGLHTAGV